MHRLLSVFLGALVLLFCGIAIAQQSAPGGEVGPTAAQQAHRSRTVIEALPDGDQPVIIEHKSGQLPTGVVSDEFSEKVPEGPTVYSPLWERLDKLSLAEKENALIQLEVPHDLAKLLLGQVREIEELWNTGEFDQATARLRNLEEKQNFPGIAAGISWKVPIMTFGPKWGTDVQISSDVSKPCLDFEDGTGNLFAVLEHYPGDPSRWTTNTSTDGGATWLETYSWSGDVVHDVGAAVMDTFLYVAYVARDAFGDVDVARIRRFFTSNGDVDAAYYYKVVFDKDIHIRWVALTTDEDAYPEWGVQVYYLAILADGTLVYHFTNDGLTWYEVATGITNAERGLDACFQKEDWFLWVSYVDSTDNVRVARRWEAVGWESIALDVIGPEWSKTSVAAYENRIMVVYEYPDYDIRYKVSYDGGEEWFWGWIAYSADEPPFSHKPRVTGRRGGGFAVVWGDYSGEEPEPFWFTNRDYGTGPGTALWSVPQTLNEVGVHTGYPMAVEWIPPLDPACHAYGAIWIHDVYERGAYFDRNDYQPGDATGDGVVNVADVVHVVNFLYRGGAPPIPMGAGDANCDGIVNVADVVYLVNYLYRGGDPPCCP
jgi:hypothetical protein